jgi:hypothetical protein
MPVAAAADVYIFVNPRDDSYHVVRPVVGNPENDSEGRAAPAAYRTVDTDARDHSPAAPTARLATDRTDSTGRRRIAP